ncbi:hypothetical protein ACNKHX_22760 [Shigella flexneri]
MGGAGLCATIWAVIFPQCWRSKLARVSRSGCRSGAVICGDWFFGITVNLMLVE